MIHGSNVIDTLRVSKDHRFHKRSLHALTTKPIGMDRVSLELDEEPQRQLHHAQVKAHLSQSAIVRASSRRLFSNRPRWPQRLCLRIPSPSSTPRQRFFTSSGGMQQQTQAKMDT
jgi:hypothetical protein